MPWPNAARFSDLSGTGQRTCYSRRWPSPEDAQQAAGRLTRIDPELATDGINEVITVFL